MAKGHPLLFTISLILIFVVFHVFVAAHAMACEYLVANILYFTVIASV